MQDVSDNCLWTCVISIGVAWVLPLLGSREQAPANIVHCSFQVQGLPSRWVLQIQESQYGLSSIQYYSGAAQDAAGGEQSSLYENHC